MKSKGFYAMIIGAIIPIIILIIGAVIAWWFSNTYPVVCNFAGTILDRFGLGGLCFWIQFLIVMLIMGYIASKFR